ncbi:MAG: p [Gammaproteobacteria bacterium]|nr:p [Gammaproteobacteria bacterium]
MRNYSPQPLPSSMWKKSSHFIAFGFGSGAAPFAPGTFGTLMGIPFYLAMQSLSHVLYLILLVLIILASMWLCDKVSKEIGIHDHSGMCLDEIVGYLVTMYAAPHGILWIWLGFLLFRLFDIWKPWPINYIDEKVSGGVGIILDDVLAGVYSMIILRILSWI